MSTCTEHRMLNMLHHSSIFCQLAQARPHNVLHFLVHIILGTLQFTTEEVMNLDYWVLCNFITITMHSLYVG